MSWKRRRRIGQHRKTTIRSTCSTTVKIEQITADYLSTWLILYVGSDEGMLRRGFLSKECAH